MRVFFCFGSFLGFFRFWNGWGDFYWRFFFELVFFCGNRLGFMNLWESVFSKNRGIL